MTKIFGAFNDRSTRDVHPHISFFGQNWSRGLLWAGKAAVATKKFWATVSEIWPRHGEWISVASGNREGTWSATYHYFTLNLWLIAYIASSCENHTLISKIPSRKQEKPTQWWRHNLAVAVPAPYICNNRYALMLATLWRHQGAR